MGRRLLVPLILVAVLLTVAVPTGTASAKSGAMVLRDRSWERHRAHRVAE